MTDQFAAQGFVVLAVGWQTFEQSPADATVDQLLRDSIALLSTREDVDTERLGLTGFCAGGRYTMLFLPQIYAFGAGVAWYGFPYTGENATRRSNQLPQRPNADHSRNRGQPQPHQ